MNSINDYNFEEDTFVNGKKIIGIEIIPENDYIKVLVAIEWYDHDRKPNIAIMEAPVIGNTTISKELIESIITYGNDVTEDNNMRKYFSEIYLQSTDCKK
ncbi:MAG: hypothetical protein JJU02_14815 [Cryomorphaceae bacterium]|nr:hypothetical protein [Cryomorphaceae bacterium]